VGLYLKVQDSPQKIEENILKTVSRQEPKQRKEVKDSKPLPKVKDVKSQRIIIKVDGHIFEKIVSRNGFIWRRITDQEVTGEKPIIDKEEQKLLAKIQRVRKKLNS